MSTGRAADLPCRPDGLGDTADKAARRGRQRPPQYDPDRYLRQAEATLARQQAEVVTGGCADDRDPSCDPAPPQLDANRRAQLERAKASARSTGERLHEEVEDGVRKGALARQKRVEACAQRMERWGGPEAGEAVRRAAFSPHYDPDRYRRQAEETQARQRAARRTVRPRRAYVRDRAPRRATRASFARRARAPARPRRAEPPRPLRKASPAALASSGRRSNRLARTAGVAS